MYLRIVKIMFLAMVALLPLTAMEDRSAHLAARLNQIEEETQTINQALNCNITPLMFCLMNSEYRPYAVLFLHEFINVKNADGLTPLMLAVEMAEEYVSLLLDNGAHVSILDNQGYTALDQAREAHKLATVKILEQALVKEIAARVSSDHSDHHESNNKSPDLENRLSRDDEQNNDPVGESADENEESASGFDSDSEFQLGEDTDFFSLADKIVDNFEDTDDMSDTDLSAFGNSIEQLNDFALEDGKAAVSEEKRHQCKKSGCSKTYATLKGLR